MQTIKNKLKSLKNQKLDIEKALCEVLLMYRRSVHPATGQSPCMMLMNRQLRTRLDLMIPNSSARRTAPVFNQTHGNNNVGPQYALDLAHKFQVTGSVCNISARDLEF